MSVARDVKHVFKKHMRGLQDAAGKYSVWKSSPKTGKRLQKTGPSSPVFDFLMNEKLEKDLFF